MNLDQEPEPDCDVVLNQDTASVASQPGLRYYAKTKSDLNKSGSKKTGHNALKHLDCTGQNIQHTQANIPPLAMLLRLLGGDREESKSGKPGVLSIMVGTAMHGPRSTAPTDS